jgi:2-iminobutanoate/2-iminopropanoate deaminase
MSRCGHPSLDRIEEAHNCYIDGLINLKEYNRIREMATNQIKEELFPPRLPNPNNEHRGQFGGEEPKIFRVLKNARDLYDKISSKKKSKISPDDQDMLKKERDGLIEFILRNDARGSFAGHWVSSPPFVDEHEAPASVAHILKNARRRLKLDHEYQLYKDEIMAALSEQMENKSRKKPCLAEGPEDSEPPSELVRQDVVSETLFKARGPFSHVVKVANMREMVFTSTITALDREWNVIGTTIEEQTRQTIRCLKIALEEAGVTIKDVVSVTWYLVNIDDMPAVGESSTSRFVVHLSLPFSRIGPLTLTGLCTYTLHSLYDSLFFSSVSPARVREEMFEGCKPSSGCIPINKLLLPQLMLEVSAIAVR